MLKSSLVAGLVLLAVGLVSVVQPTVSYAQGAKEEILTGAEEASGETRGSADGTITTTVQNIVNLFSWIVGVAAVLAIIYGGFRYITSGGDSSAVSSAKRIVIFAIVGLIIVVLAQMIVLFVVRGADNGVNTGGSSQDDGGNNDGGDEDDCRPLCE